MSQHSRRDFVARVAATAAAVALGGPRLTSASGAPARAVSEQTPGRRTPDGSEWQHRRRLLLPPRLRAGDTVGLVNPAGVTWNPIDIDVVRETFEALGLRVLVGERVLDRYGYLAGRDADRAADLNAMFTNPEVKGVICVRGGWGSARLLHLLDYDAIARQPKVLLGYSDITALHTAIHARTGLVSFHGPVGSARWNSFNVEWLRRVLFDGEAVTFANDNRFDVSATLVQRDNRTRVVQSGVARGRLLGGNLTVLSALMGSDYLPDFSGCVLFLEDVEEAPYRIDRMLTQLALAGVLNKAAAVVFGRCTDCSPGAGYGSLTLDDVLVDRLKPLGIPAWYGAQFGHIDSQFTLPVGAEVEVDADAGTIRMLAPAVQ